MAKARSGETTRTIGERTVRVTSLDKPMYPDADFTKRDVIDYYTAVAEVLLPQLRNRVLTRIRYPDGTGGERFFERNAPPWLPKWMRVFSISASPGTGKPAKLVKYPVIDDLAGLIWMANQAALELNTPQWHIGPRGGIGKPDRMVFDLDPGEGVDIAETAEIAHLVAARLAEDSLLTVPVSSGSKGIHLYAPVGGKRTSLSIHAYAKSIARELAASHPDRIVAVIGKSERAGKVMIDWSQNHPARSTITPYSLRGKRVPTVAAPRRWEEIDGDLKQLTPEEVIKRLDEEGDLMA